MNRNVTWKNKKITNISIVKKEDDSFPNISPILDE